MLTKADLVNAKQDLNKLYNAAEESTEDWEKKRAHFERYERLVAVLGQAEELLGAYDKRALEALKGRL